MASSFDFEHDTLGHYLGRLRGNDIVQFRGIPYATIASRFRQSVVVDSLPFAPLDAREAGPICPQPTMLQIPFWPDAPTTDGLGLAIPIADELKCLNLNITVPRQSLEEKRAASLPVLVFIHGGAMVTGSSSQKVGGRELFDCNNLVRSSIQSNQSIVAVTINYRVGPLGFLVSMQLKAFNESHNEPVGNYGLHDQRRALEWIHKNISGFGGDPNNITIHGTSAGAASCHYQTTFPDALFQRAILSSGTLQTIGPTTLERQQSVFDHYITLLGGDPSDQQEAMHLIQQVPAEQITEAMVPSTMLLYCDGEYISEDGQIESPDIDIMVGAAAWEHDIVEFLLRKIPQDLHSMSMSNVTDNLPPKDDAEVLEFATHIFESTPLIPSNTDFPFAYPDIMSAYGLTKRPNESFSGWPHIVGDIAFRLPSYHVARSSNARTCLLYNMGSTSPFPMGHAYGRAHHGVNDMFLFDVAADHVAEKDVQAYRGAVNQWQQACIGFCHGKLPWEPLRTGREADFAAFGPVFNFQNGTEGKLCQTVRDVVGDEEAERWSMIMDLTR